MKKLYCPECGEYLEGGSGEMVDCVCGWTQPEEKEEQDQFVIGADGKKWLI